MSTQRELEQEIVDLDTKMTGLAAIWKAAGEGMEAIRARRRDIDKELASIATSTPIVSITDKIVKMNDLIKLGSVAAIASEEAKLIEEPPIEGQLTEGQIA